MSKSLFLVCLTSLLLVGCSEQSKNHEPENMLVGKWVDSNATNSWLQFTADGKLIYQDGQTVSFGSYAIISATNMTVILDNTTSTASLYFPSRNEVVTVGAGKTLLLRRAN